MSFDLNKMMLKRALAEFDKRAFVSMPGGQPPAGGQAPGPDGMPVDPMAGGAPMDPGMGGAPMDPGMGGAPMDPGMGGEMPPMPPMDPGMDPLADLPPVDGEDGGSEGLTAEDAEVADKITRRTMDIVRETLEMVGKAKPREGEEAADAEAAAPAAPAPVPPEQQPGPVTGRPGFSPDMIDGPLKL